MKAFREGFCLVFLLCGFGMPITLGQTVFPLKFTCPPLAIYLDAVTYAPPVLGIPAQWVSLITVENNSNTQKHDVNWGLFIKYTLLVDEHGNRYKSMPYILMPLPEKHTLYPGEETTLFISFDVPVAQAKHFTLVVGFVEGFNIKTENPQFMFERQDVKPFPFK